MTKTQKKNLFYIILFFVVLFISSWYAYKRYERITEEGQVYLDLFEPNPYIKEFEHSIVVSHPSDCLFTKEYLTEFPEKIVLDFFDVNNNLADPIRLVILEEKVPIVSWEDTIKLHNTGAINKFLPEKHVVAHLARVAFNDGLNEAITCIQFFSHQMTVRVLYYLKKIDNKWQIIDYHTIRS
ncbi:MAG: hypothetical protein OEY19_13495 [Gammaproteobacteria bacterium]|nr:hypothetical protein [Gammaproteobacteria bacterium]MDH5630012.1 hypothetical protein [Gammaproteobacteria bacterium]